MARLPKIRVSYHNDAQYMLRLIHAIEHDSKRPIVWRKQLVAKLQTLANDFINAPAVND